MEQLELFDSQIIRYDHLVANSPKQAFYRLWLESCAGKYRIRKESGIKGKVLDRRSWRFPSLEQAEKNYCRRLRQKTNPDRKSPRKYKIAGFRQNPVPQKVKPSVRFASAKRSGPP